MIASPCVFLALVLAFGWRLLTYYLLFLSVGGCFSVDEFGLTMLLDAEFGTKIWFFRLRSICLIGSKYGILLHFSVMSFHFIQCISMKLTL